MLETDKAHIHSFRGRIKDPEHLIEKIVRKRKENYKKYKTLARDGYEKFVTDLIGIRCFILFKAEWVGFHRYITHLFENNAKYYVNDSLMDFDEDETHNYHAEAPKAYIRVGDDKSIYESILPKEYIIEKGGKVYRSVHYILKFKGIYLEIQVRTLFEEGWGEIDHKMVYPYFRDNPTMNMYTNLLNRLTGLADEMGTFLLKYNVKRLL